MGIGVQELTPELAGRIGYEESGGAIITETLFKVNGIGQLLLTALFANDLPMVMTLTFIFAILIVVFNLIADVLYGVLDPRIRYD